MTQFNKNFLKLILHIFIIMTLTILTQIGGVIYLISVLMIKKSFKSKRTKRALIFGGLYLLSTLIIVPQLAPIFGREKIKETELVKAHTFITKLTNRNYVTPQLNQTLQTIAKGLDQKHQGIILIYLDANFPFVDGFPLLPHLSHKDGKKIDLAFIYQDEYGVTVNNKPSKSGYGIYVSPIPNIENHTTICKNKDHWQYDFSKYLTFGTSVRNLKLDKQATRDLLLTIVKQPNIKKVFLEPHLKIRLKLKSDKIRFQGCHSVRHDDHIHLQL